MTENNPTKQAEERCCRGYENFAVFDGGYCICMCHGKTVVIVMQTGEKC